MPFATISYKVDSDVVRTEEPNRFSRDEIDLPSGTVALKCGSLVSKLTATGAFAAYDPNGTNGSQTPVAVLLQSVDASAAPKRAVALARSAEIVRQSIEWPAGTTDTQKGAAFAALQTHGIVARLGV